MQLPDRTLQAAATAIRRYGVARQQYIDSPSPSREAYLENAYLNALEHLDDPDIRQKLDNLLSEEHVSDYQREMLSDGNPIYDIEISVASIFGISKNNLNKLLQRPTYEPEDINSAEGLRDIFTKNHERFLSEMNEVPNLDKKSKKLRKRDLRLGCIYIIAGLGFFIGNIPFLAAWTPSYLIGALTLTNAIRPLHGEKL